MKSLSLARDPQRLSMFIFRHRKLHPCAFRHGGQRVERKEPGPDRQGAKLASSTEAVGSQRLLTVPRAVTVQ